MKRKTPSKFLYEAYDKKGVVVRGAISMHGKGEVLSHLLSQGLKPIRIKESGDDSSILGARLFERIRVEDILFFARNLATTLRMGVSATESLELIMSDIENEKMRALLRDVLESVRAGNSFAESFRKHEKHFPHMFIGMLEAGEFSGNLDATLTTFADYLDRSHAFKGRVRSALLYPSILAIVSIAVSLLVIMMLIPRLSNIFSEVNIVLPAITRVLITVSEMLTFNYLLDLGVIVLCSGLFVWFRATKTGKDIFSRIAIQAPGTRDLVRKTILVRITRTLGTMLASGVPITMAMELAGKSGGNEQFRVAVSRVSEHINAGTSVSSAFSDESDFFPRLLVGLIAVGERTGKLSDTLLSIAEFYERGVDERLKRFSSLLEPILLLIIGLVVGAIALAVLLPVYQLVGAVR